MISICILNYNTCSAYHPMSCSAPPSANPSPVQSSPSRSPSPSAPVHPTSPLRSSSPSPGSAASHRQGRVPPIRTKLEEPLFGRLQELFQASMTAHPQLHEFHALCEQLCISSFAVSLAQCPTSLLSCFTRGDQSEAENMRHQQTKFKKSQSAMYLFAYLCHQWKSQFPVSQQSLHQYPALEDITTIVYIYERWHKVASNRRRQEQQDRADQGEQHSMAVISQQRQRKRLTDRYLKKEDRLAKQSQADHSCGCPYHVFSSACL